ncbi:MAG: acyltransferase [Lachnospiraceae bacterium]|nr:acyltransferase [Lachnospiraceae bacterium]
MKGNGTERNRQIEGLRGFAILIIVFFHLIYRYSVLYQVDVEMQKKEFPMSWWGDFGVIIFLIISIWYLHPEEKKDNRVLTTLKNRYIKLWPAYAICITITFLLSGTGYLPGRAVGLKTYLINLTLLEGVIPGVDYVDGAHWYLTTLLLITFWMLLINRWCRESNWAYVLWLLACIVFRFLPEPFYIGGKILASEYVGVVIFVVNAKRIKWEDIGRTWKENIAGFIMLFIAIVYMVAVKGSGYGYMMCVSLGIFMICYRRKGRFLENYIFTYTGKISYPLFLVHQNVSYMIENFLTERFGKYSLTFVVPAFAVSYSLAIAIYYIVPRIRKVAASFISDT